MVEAGRGLIVEVTDGATPGYRGQLLYDLIKSSVIRLAYACLDLAATGLTALAITPGFLRSEQMLRNFGVTETNWRDGVAKDRFSNSPRPRTSSAARSRPWPPTPTSAPSPAALWASANWR